MCRRTPLCILEASWRGGGSSGVLNNIVPTLEIRLDDIRLYGSKTVAVSSKSARDSRGGASFVTTTRKKSGYPRIQSFRDRKSVV